MIQEARPWLGKKWPASIEAFQRACGNEVEAAKRLSEYSDPPVSIASLRKWRSGDTRPAKYRTINALIAVGFGQAELPTAAWERHCGRAVPNAGYVRKLRGIPDPWDVSNALAAFWRRQGYSDEDAETMAANTFHHYGKERIMEIVTGAMA